MNRQLPFLLGRVFNTPLLITPAKLDAFMLALPALFTRGAMLREDEEQTPRERRASGYAIEAGVAVLPIRGVLVRRDGQIDTHSSPLQSYERIGRNFRGALADSRVRAILLDIDSPGGESGNVLDLARDIRAGTQVKPVWAIANDDAFSAGYALASAAERVWTTRTGGVGSVGVVALHSDQSRFDEQEGFRYSYVYAGARKIDGHPHAPLGAEAHARIQAEVDRLHGMFVETVARHRGIWAEAVAATEADLYFGQAAIEARLADQLGTPAEAHAALAARVAPKPARSNAMTEQLDPTAQDATQEAPSPALTEPGLGTFTLDPAHLQTAQIKPSPEPPVDNVIALATAASQRSTERAAEIVALCITAEQPALATELIRGGMTVEQVRRHLGDLALQQAAAPIVPISTERPEQAGPQPPPRITSAESFAVANAAIKRS